MHHLYCCRKAFYEIYDKCNGLSNFKSNLSFDSTSSKIAAAELSLKDTFLRTWNFVLNYHWSLNIQFN